MQLQDAAIPKLSGPCPAEPPGRPERVWGAAPSSQQHRPLRSRQEDGAVKSDTSGCSVTILGLKILVGF